MKFKFFEVFKNLIFKLEKNQSFKTRNRKNSIKQTLNNKT